MHDSREDVALQSAPSVRALPAEGQAGRAFSWQSIIPGHRLPVAAKTLILVALGVYAAGGNFASLPVWLSMGLATSLWTFLYIVNEAADIEAEEGRVVPASAWRVLTGGPLLVCAAGLFVSPLLALYLSLMFLGQWAYCMPPFRWKRRWWAILALSGVANPLLRIGCGAMWGTKPLPLIACVVLVCLHLGATLRARLLQKERDRRLGYTVVPPWGAFAGRCCTGVGLAGAFALCPMEVLPVAFAPLVLLFAVPFAVFAWSGQAKSMAQLRRFWLVFAILAALALGILLFSHR
jgi:hypothetical protein